MGKMKQPIFNMTGSPFAPKMDAEDMADMKKGIKQTPSEEKKDKIKKTGSFKGKSNALGHGGRAAQLKAKGVPGAVIGMLARKAGAAPGMKNFHGKMGGKK